MPAVRKQERIELVKPVREQVTLRMHCTDSKMQTCQMYYYKYTSFLTKQETFTASKSRQLSEIQIALVSSHTYATCCEVVCCFE